MRVQPLAKCFGAVVEDVDLATMSEGEWAELHAAFLEHGALVIKANALSSKEQTAFGERFGNIEFGGNPMTNAAKDGAVMDVNTQMMRTNM